MDGPQAAVDIEGTVEAGFEGVRDAFERNFVEHGEVGAGFSLVVGGRTVVDLWGGVADVATGRRYDADTLQLVFSSTKGATALCANLLAQRGELVVDAPVATYWPEFTQAGKGDVPVRWLLCHKAGLPYVEAPLTLADALAWDPAVEALAAQAPLWEPGTAHGYHAVTYGWLVGEVIRRITGRSPGAFFADEVAGPLGLDFWIGLPDDLQYRVAPLTSDGHRSDGDVGDRGARSALIAVLEQLLGPGSLLAKALGGTSSGVFSDDGVFNRPDVRAAELPGANGITNARSLARMYAAAVGPVEVPAEAGGAGGNGAAAGRATGRTVGPLLTPEQVAAASLTQTSGVDRVLIFDTTFGLGFMTSSPFSPYGSATSFGHAGAGGSLGFADPTNGIGFGYVMNRMLTNLSGDPRTRGLVQATYEALGLTTEFV